MLDFDSLEISLDTGQPISPEEVYRAYHGPGMSDRRKTNRSNQALERTAARRAFAFQMIKTVSVEATLALGGGRSAWSR